MHRTCENKFVFSENIANEAYLANDLLFVFSAVFLLSPLILASVFQPVSTAVASVLFQYRLSHSLSFLPFMQCWCLLSHLQIPPPHCWFSNYCLHERHMVLGPAMCWWAWECVCWPARRPNVIDNCKAHWNLFETIETQFEVHWNHWNIFIAFLTIQP